jgi:hypothetical protein
MTAVDPGRLARAIHLDVESNGAGEWSVTGGRGRHCVTIGERGTICDCADSDLHPELACKHRLAVALVRLPAEVREALRELVPVRTSRRVRRVA